MEAFDFIQDLPLWIDEQIFLLGGQDMIEPATDPLPTEVKIGVMDDLDKKIFTLVSLQQEKKNAIIQEISDLQAASMQYLQELNKSSEEETLEDEEDDDQDIDDEIKGEGQNDPEPLDTPYNEPIRRLLKEYLDITWLQEHCARLGSLKVGLKLSYFGDFAFTRGFEIYAVPGSNQLNQERLDEEFGSSGIGMIVIDFSLN